jgi:hypothetical protein
MNADSLTAPVKLTSRLPCRIAADKTSAATLSDTHSKPCPYKTPGIFPDCRSRRFRCFPWVFRDSTANCSAICILETYAQTNYLHLRANRSFSRKTGEMQPQRRKFSRQFSFGRSKVHLRARKLAANVAKNPAAAELRRRILIDD